MNGSGMNLRKKLIFSVCSILLINGCTTTYEVTKPSKTAAAELIQSFAEQRAVDSFNIVLPRAPTYIDYSNFNGNPYFKQLITNYILAKGIPVVRNVAQAQYIVYATSQVDSINERSWELGIPAMQADGYKTPSLPLYGNDGSMAISQFQLTATDANGNEVAVAASKYGIQTYHVLSLFLAGSFIYPNLNQKYISR